MYVYVWGQIVYIIIHVLLTVRELEEQRRIKIKSKIKQLNDAKLQVFATFKTKNIIVWFLLVPVILVE